MHDNEDLCGPCCPPPDSPSPPRGLFLGRVIDYPPISEKEASKVTNYALKHFGRLMGTQEFQNLKKNTRGGRSIKQLEHADVELGELLGEGGLSDVYAIKASPPLRFSSELNQAEEETKESSEEFTNKYVVKTLRKDIESASKLATCAFGLAKEAAILQALDHPHIIRLRASSDGGLASLT